MFPTQSQPMRNPISKSVVTTCSEQAHRGIALVSSSCWHFHVVLRYKAEAVPRWRAESLRASLHTPKRRYLLRHLHIDSLPQNLRWPPLGQWCIVVLLQIQSSRIHKLVGFETKAWQRAAKRWVFSDKFVMATHTLQLTKILVTRSAAWNSVPKKSIYLPENVETCAPTRGPQCVSLPPWHDLVHSSSSWVFPWLLFHGMALLQLLPQQKTFGC